MANFTLLFNQIYLYSGWLFVFACCSETIKHFACSGCGFKAVCRTHSWIVVWISSLLHSKHLQPCGLSLQWLLSRGSGGSPESKTSVKTHMVNRWNKKQTYLFNNLVEKFTAWRQIQNSRQNISFYFRSVKDKNTASDLVQQADGGWRGAGSLKGKHNPPSEKQAETTAPAVGFVFPPLQHLTELKHTCTLGAFRSCSKYVVQAQGNHILSHIYLPLVSLSPSLQPISLWCSTSFSCALVSLCPVIVWSKLSALTRRLLWAASLCVCLSGSRSGSTRLTEESIWGEGRGRRRGMTGRLAGGGGKAGGFLWEIPESEEGKNSGEVGRCCFGSEGLKKRWADQ